MGKYLPAARATGEEAECQLKYKCIRPTQMEKASFAWSFFMFYKNVPLTAEKEINDETRIWIRAVKYYEVLGNFFVLKKKSFFTTYFVFHVHRLCGCGVGSEIFQSKRWYMYVESDRME